MRTWHQKYEMLGMAEDGWIIDLDAKACECIMNKKDGSCVHVLAAYIHKLLPFPGYVPPEKTIVNRRIKRSKPTFASTPRPRGRRGGRYPAPGPALDIE